MKCWVCLSENMEKVKESNLPSVNETPENFKITDNNFGVTGTLHKCSYCTFIQCIDFTNSNEMYERMEDLEYETGRSVRKREMLHILKYAQKIQKFSSILDIGAGSGILLEVAESLGYESVGIEPSYSLAEIAVGHDLKVKQGYFPSDEISGKFDLITLIDVIEHLNEPESLIKDLFNNLQDNGFVIISTPDVSSKFARLMKWNWWHYRVAHIGYFNQSTLDLLMKRCGFENTGYNSRPLWFFQADYITKRILKLITRHEFSLRFLRGLTVRVNLHDSILSAYRKIH